MNSSQIREEIQSYLEKGEIEKALNALITALNKSSLRREHDNALLLKAQWEGIKQEQLRGILSRQEYEVAVNKIVVGVQTVTNDVHNNKTALEFNQKIEDPFYNQMVKVKGGVFQMGSNLWGSGKMYQDEKPIHDVNISTFKISKYLVTRKQWKYIMNFDIPASEEVMECDQCPIKGVSWYDTQNFISRLNQKTGQAYRLPSESEWEFAARGGKLSRGYDYPGSNDADKVAWHNISNGGRYQAAYPVGEKLPNELGLYDMSGNAEEWVEDDWHDNYNGAPNDGKPWLDINQKDVHKVLRGGYWCGNPDYCRSADRGHADPNISDYYKNKRFGFRLAHNK